MSNAVQNTQCEWPCLHLGEQIIFRWFMIKSPLVKSFLLTPVGSRTFEYCVAGGETAIARLRRKIGTFQIRHYVKACFFCHTRYLNELGLSHLPHFTAQKKAKIAEHASHSCEATVNSYADLQNLGSALTLTKSNSHEYGEQLRQVSTRTRQK
jgi:hypothetical protein